MKNEITAMVILYIGAVLFVFGMYTGLVYVICWAIGTAFMWKYVLGVWALAVLIKLLFKKGL